MAKRKSSGREKKIPQIYIVGIVILLVLLIGGFFAYKVFAKPNNYIIENKYYGFELQTPSGWHAQENTNYSENSIAEILKNCKNDKLNKNAVYEVGAFKFGNQKDNEGVVFEVLVYCVPENYTKVRNKLVFFYNNFKYVITEHNYIPLKDKTKEKELAENYQTMFNQILSSFKVIR